jgi:hypothetical protein
MTGWRHEHVEDEDSFFSTSAACVKREHRNVRITRDVRLWEERKGDRALPYAPNMYRTVCVSLDVVAFICAFSLAQPADGYIVLIYLLAVLLVVCTSMDNTGYT